MQEPAMDHFKGSGINAVTDESNINIKGEERGRDENRGKYPFRHG